MKMDQVLKMKLDAAGIDFIVTEEGMVLRPYFDAAGVATIGVGCTYYEDGRKVKITDKPITEARAISLFLTLVKDFEYTVNRIINVNINQNQFNALVSLCFNIGSAALINSTVIKMINKKAPIYEIEAWWLVWNKAAGKPILLDRRKREIQLYISPAIG